MPLTKYEGYWVLKCEHCPATRAIALKNYMHGLREWIWINHWIKIKKPARALDPERYLCPGCKSNFDIISRYFSSSNMLCQDARRIQYMKQEPILAGTVIEAILNGKIDTLPEWVQEAFRRGQIGVSGDAITVYYGQLGEETSSILLPDELLFLEY